MPYPHHGTTRQVGIFRDLLIQEVKRRLFEESIPRLKKCLAELDQDQIWYRPNEHSNSVGNLVLHLCGNMRQWILSGLAGRPDIRERQAEFERTEPLPTEALVGMLNTLETEVDQALDEVQPEDLISAHDVQTFRESGLSILVHVVEHCSYHVGQVTYVVKALKNIDTHYYKDIPLE